MSVVNLKGKPIDQIDENDIVRQTLQDIIDKIDSGKIKTMDCYFVYAVVNESDRSLVKYNSISSDMSIADAVYMLEIEKLRILRGD